MHAALTPLAPGALVVLIALAGCSTPAAPPPAASPAAVAPALAAQEDEHAMTGSRIPKRKSTDRMLKTVGGQEARDAMDSVPRPLDSNRAY